MAKRKPFALRIDESVLNAMQRYADDDLRSLNAQIEFVLRDVLRSRGRLPAQNSTQNVTQEAAKDAGQEPARTASSSKEDRAS